MTRVSLEVPNWIGHNDNDMSNDNCNDDSNNNHNNEQYNHHHHHKVCSRNHSKRGGIELEEQHHLDETSPLIAAVHSPSIGPITISTNNINEQEAVVGMLHYDDGRKEEAITAAETKIHNNHYSLSSLSLSTCCTGCYYLWIKYNEILEKRPLIVKIITATIILGCADLLAQSMEQYYYSIAPDADAAGDAAPADAVVVVVDDFDIVNVDVATTSTDTMNKDTIPDSYHNNHWMIDWTRSIRFGLIGFVGAPWSHYYFAYLDYYLPPTMNPCTCITLYKLCIDQFIQSPLMLAMMICFLCLLEGRGWNGIKDDMNQTYYTSLIANWKLWFPASFINLGFVKPSLRVLYVNVVFFAWIVILSLLLNDKKDTNR